MKVCWSPKAIKDLKEISRFIGKDNPAAARRYAGKLKERAEGLSRFPKRGRIVPELNCDAIREVIEGNYRIAYKVEKEFVTILTVFEGHRLLETNDDEM